MGGWGCQRGPARAVASRRGTSGAHRSTRETERRETAASRVLTASPVTRTAGLRRQLLRSTHRPHPGTSSRERGAPVGDLPPWRLLGCEQTGLPSIPELRSRSLRQNPHLQVFAQQFFCWTVIFRTHDAHDGAIRNSEAPSCEHARTCAGRGRARQPAKVVCWKALRSRRAVTDHASPPIPAHSTPAATRTPCRSRTW